MVVDLGCGPGFTAFELANWVGPSGHVHGIEANADFVELARSVARARGLEKVVYVDDPVETYRECRRILRQGGRAHGVEGDWGLALADPIPEEDWKALVRAASCAFRTTNAGRQLYGYARVAGFTDVTLSVVCRPDTTGRLLPMVRNLCAYAREGGALESHKIDAVLDSCEKQRKRRSY